MNPEKKSVNVWLGFGIMLCIYSIVSGLIPDPATQSHLSLYQYAIANIFTGIAGIVGGVIVLFNLYRQASRKKITKRNQVCPTCGAALRDKEDQFCHNCGARLD